MHHLQPGSFLKRGCYKIVQTIGEGGFGITYLALELGLIKLTGYGEEFESYETSRKVVIKELYYKDFCHRDSKTGMIAITNSDRKIEFEKLVNKQLDEGKILKRLDHHNIVKTKDIFEENATAYMVMDHIIGMNLEEIVNRSGRLIKKDALHYIKQVLSAAAYIHGKKILHLDITPSNILVRKNSKDAVLVDFGSSLTYGVNSHIEVPTSKLVAGFKHHYAPFEQQDIDNLKEFDSTYDTYAIGATLYFLLTGIPPPVSSSIASGKEKIIEPSVKTMSNEINDYLDAVAVKALSPVSANRFNSALEMEKAIDKEQFYEAKIKLIKKLMGNSSFTEAMVNIENAEQLFLTTPTLNTLKNKCKEGLAKKQALSAEQNEKTKPIQFKSSEKTIVAVNKNVKTAKTNSNTQKLFLLIAGIILISICGIFFLGKSSKLEINQPNADTAAMATPVTTIEEPQKVDTNTVVIISSPADANKKFIDSLKAVIALSYNQGSESKAIKTQMRYMKSCYALGKFYEDEFNAGRDSTLEKALYYYEEITDLTDGTDSDLFSNEEPINFRDFVTKKVVDLYYNSKTGLDPIKKSQVEAVKSRKGYPTDFGYVTNQQNNSFFKILEEVFKKVYGENYTVGLGEIKEQEEYVEGFYLSFKNNSSRLSNQEKIELNNPVRLLRDQSKFNLVIMQNVSASEEHYYMPLQFYRLLAISSYLINHEHISRDRIYYTNIPLREGNTQIGKNGVDIKCINYSPKTLNPREKISF